MEKNKITAIKSQFDETIHIVDETDVEYWLARELMPLLGERGIKPEKLPPSEDIKKLERRVKLREKKIAEQSGKLPAADDEKTQED